MHKSIDRLCDATIRLVQAVEAVVILGDTIDADSKEFSVMFHHLGKLKSEATDAVESVQEYFKNEKGI